MSTKISLMNMSEMLMISLVMTFLVYFLMLQEFLRHINFLS